MVQSHAQFVWYELITTDVRAAKGFYRSVMGWGTWDASMPGRPYTLFMAGDFSACGLMPLPEDAKTTGTRPSWTGYVAVDDVDDTADRIPGLGGLVHVPPTTIGSISRFSVFSDPQSARLALFKWLKPGQQPPANRAAAGRVGWHELLTTDPAVALIFYGALFGWRTAESDGGEPPPYQLFSAGHETIGGMVDKPPAMPSPSWLYYFNVSDIDAAARRVKAGGGQILEGPIAVPGGSWVVRCSDPQGALFALEGMRVRKPVGYFLRAGPGGAPGTQGGRWSW